MKILQTLFVFLLISYWVSCNTSQKKQKEYYQTAQKEPSFGDWVVLSIPVEPDNLNPFMGISAYSLYMYPLLYQSLTIIDNATNTEKPLLSEHLPFISADGLRYTYQIRSDAVWDNGTPILAEDVVFSLKTILHPYTHTNTHKPYYTNIQNVELYPENPRKITFIFKQKDILLRYSIGSMYILPRYIFDEQNRMSKFSLTDIINGQDRLKQNPDFMKFAEEFNNPSRLRDPKFHVGSGGYFLEKWSTQQQIVFRRKKTWWGYKHSHEHSAFQAYPDKIIYKIINTGSTIITELKAGNIDAAFGIYPKDFEEIQQNDLIKHHFNFYTTKQPAIIYIGLNNLPKNTTHPALADVKVRRAIAHLTDVDKMLEKIYYNYGTRISNFGLTNNKEISPSSFEPISYNLQIAKQLLDESGWKDTDYDGIRDKIVHGKKYNLTLEFILPTGSATSQNIALMLQQSAKPAGIKIDLVSQEANVFIQKLKNRDFDLYTSGWTIPPTIFDSYQIFHSKSIENGGNFVGFNNPKADKLIEKIRTEFDENERRKIYYELQKIIYDQQPYIFLWQPKERLIIHKRFQNQVIFDANPGFSPNMFWTPKEYVKYR